MVDLFDIKVGGAGWHITSHLIALVALFVACFAIAGYITFRDDSVPGKALKDHDVDVKDIDANTLTLSGAGTATIDFLTLSNILSGTFVTPAESWAHAHAAHEHPEQSEQ